MRAYMESAPTINARDDEDGAWESIKRLMRRERRSLASIGDRDEKREIILASFSSRPGHGMVPQRYREYVLDDEQYTRKPGDGQTYHCCCTKPINEWTFLTNTRTSNVLRLGLDCRKAFLKERGDEDDEEDSFVTSDSHEPSVYGSDGESDGEGSASETGDEGSGSSIVVHLLPPGRVQVPKPLLRIDLTLDEAVYPIQTGYGLVAKRKDVWAFEAMPSPKRARTAGHTLLQPTPGQVD